MCSIRCVRSVFCEDVRYLGKAPPHSRSWWQREWRPAVCGRFEALTSLSHAIKIQCRLLIGCRLLGKAPPLRRLFRFVALPPSSPALSRTKMWPVSGAGNIPTRVLDNFTVSRPRTGELLQLLDLPYSCSPGVAEVRGTLGGPRGTGQALCGSLTGWGIHTAVGFNAAPPQPWVLLDGTVWPLGQCLPTYVESYMPCIGLASVLNAVVQVITSNPPDPFYRVQQLVGGLPQHLLASANV